MNDPPQRRREESICQLKSMVAVVICLLLVIIWILLPRPFETFYIVLLCISVPATFVGVSFLLERIWPTRRRP